MKKLLLLLFIPVFLFIGCETPHRDAPPTEPDKELFYIDGEIFKATFIMGYTSPDYAIIRGKIVRVKGLSHFQAASYQDELYFKQIWQQEKHGR